MKKLFLESLVKILNLQNFNMTSSCITQDPYTGCDEILKTDYTKALCNTYEQSCKYTSLC